MCEIGCDSVGLRHRNRFILSAVKKVIVRPIACFHFIFHTKRNLFNSLWLSLLYLSSYDVTYIFNKRLIYLDHRPFGPVKHTLRLLCCSGCRMQPDTVLLNKIIQKHPSSILSMGFSALFRCGFDGSTCQALM